VNNDDNIINEDEEKRREGRERGNKKLQMVAVDKKTDKAGYKQLMKITNFWDGM
jgi:hypothetical protein